MLIYLQLLGILCINIHCIYKLVYNTYIVKILCFFIYLEAHFCKLFNVTNPTLASAKGFISAPRNCKSNHRNSQ